MAKLFPDHRQNISRASSEYFRIDDDLISTDFLIAVNSPVSRCSKSEANPSEMWRVNIIFSATIVIFGFVTTILTITYKEDPPPSFTGKWLSKSVTFPRLYFWEEKLSLRGYFLIAKMWENINQRKRQYLNVFLVAENCWSQLLCSENMKKKTPSWLLEMSAEGFLKVGSPHHHCWR